MFRRAHAAWAIAAPLLLIWTLAAFQGVRDHSFLDWDDPDFVVNNVHIRSFSLTNLRWMFTDRTSGHYHPLTWLSYAADYAVWGADPRGYLLTNVLLHAANGLLLAHIVAVVIANVRPHSSARSIALVAFVSAGMFLVHPLRVEAVAWISDRKELLSAFFALLAIECYLSAGHGTARSSRWIALSAFLYCCSLLSKTMSVSLPILLCLLERWMNVGGAPSLWQQIRSKTLFWIPMIFAVWWAPHAQSTADASMPWDRYDLAHRTAQAAYSFVFYPMKSLLPTQLSCLYPLRPDFELTEPKFVVSAVVVGLVAFASLGTPRGIRYTLAGYVLIILPVSGFAQAGQQIVADRYSYFPSMLLAVAIAEPLSRFIEWTSQYRLRAAPVALTVLALFGGDFYLVTQQVEVWKDSETLWTQALRVDPRNHVASQHLGALAVQRGDLTTGKALYEQSLASAPVYNETVASLGALEVRFGQPERAAELYDRVVRQGRPGAKVLYNFANLRAVQGRHGEADRLYLRAMALKPDDPKIHANRGRLLLVMGKLRESAAEYAIACRLDPDVAEYWRGLGAAHYSVGKAYLAEEPYRKYLALAPNTPTAYAELARCLIALADPPRRAEAERLLNEASRRWPNDQAVRAAWDRFHRRTAAAERTDFQ